MLAEDTWLLSQAQRTLLLTTQPDTWISILMTVFFGLSLTGMLWVGPVDVCVVVCWTQGPQISHNQQKHAWPSFSEEATLSSQAAHWVNIYGGLSTAKDSQCLTNKTRKNARDSWWNVSRKFTWSMVKPPCVRPVVAWCFNMSMCHKS